MVLDRDSFINRVKEYIGDRNDDDTISFLEDVNDSVLDFTKEPEIDWKQKYDENDALWRKKYTDRFFSTPAEDDPIIEPERKSERFEDLFKEA